MQVLLPAKAPRRRRKVPWLIGGAVVVVAAAVTAVLIVLNQGDEPQPGKVVAQYHYQFTAPQDWTQTGGQAQFRATLMKPADAIDKDDAISVQEYELSYDATADPAHLADNLRQQAQQAGPSYTGFNADASFGGRKVIYYQQAGNFGPIDWYVVAKGKVQVNIACQYATQPAHARVASACDQVVRTLKITG
jgi:type VII secretion-associated protein (TIGR03931 family)